MTAPPQSDAPPDTTGWQRHQLTENADPAAAAGSEHTGSRSFSQRLQLVAEPLRRASGPVTMLGLVAAAAVVIGLLVVWLTNWSEFLALALVAGVLLLIASVFLVGRSSYGVEVKLQSGRVVAGERATGELVIRNTGTHRLLPARVELPVGGNLASFRVPSLPAGGSHDELFVIPTERRAVIRVGPATSVRGDPLGLLRRQVRWTGVTELYVHPQLTRLHGAATGSVKDLEGQPTRELSSNDVSFHQLRQYVPGDDRRYVHWRTSARTGVLMVRQFEETRRTHLAVALSLAADEYHTPADLELAISAAASLGVQAMSEERPVTVCAGAAVLHGASARRLLDRFSALEAEPATAGVVGAGQLASSAVPNASVAVMITGGAVSPPVLRHAGAGFSVGVRVVALQVRSGAALSLGTVGRVDVATVGSLDELPRALRSLKAA
ncbi:DUF58 domain-containing protein [Nakamurella aerolata]|uniref:DUF58 domain-containing protein n=1 Tax=Nakamurella aerolata TaxID=1656892 RepID=A0A849A5Z1_9ACTN|nr:DUF58 domain-containing protein [Nakamurella aerolata]NNG35979.1 DUF58 domain-containing protein [Nakamurella aerolata]